MPRVSVLLTTWDRPGMLAEAVSSVLCQTYRDFELLILDDNSTDRDQLLILERLRHHPKCRVYVSDVTPALRREKVRYAVLANVGLALAGGEYITYLCDDDLYLPRRLERMVERLDRGDAKVVYGAQETRDGGEITGLRPAVEVLADAYCVVDHSSVMHTAGVAREVGGWDDHPALWRIADAHFWRKLNRAGHAFHPIGEVLDVHRFHPGSVTAHLERDGQPV